MSADRNLVGSIRHTALCALALVVILRIFIPGAPAFAQTSPQLPAGDVTTETPTLEEFGVRHEPALGTPSCTAADTAAKASHCTKGPWLGTRSPNFVNIRKTAYMRSRFEVVNGIQMTSTFVATKDGEDVGVLFSAEAFVRDDTVGAGRRLFVRALLDGAPMQPSNVVFATGAVATTRAFAFAGKADAGIHTVEMQWMVDSGAEGFIRDAALLVRTGVRYPPSSGTLLASAAPSGPTVTTTAPGWVNVPGLGGAVYVPPSSVLTMTVSAETFVTGDDATRRLFVRALVDGAPASPGDVVLARGSAPQSRAMTFGRAGLAAGWHNVTFQWLVDAGAVGHLGDRAQIIAAYPSTEAKPTHPYRSPPSGDSLTTSSQSFAQLLDLETQVLIGSKGNGEVAVIFSGEARSTPNTALELALAIDGVIDPDSVVAVADGHELSELKTFTFAAKQLTPGLHNVDIHWRVTGNGPGTAFLGDRSVAVMSETGFIPDLAEALRFGPARFTVGDNLVGIEPMIGARKVLTILWDPHRPAHGEPGEPDQATIPAATVQAALFGPANSADDYLRTVSGGRFHLVNAGVLGWFDNATVIWESIGDPLPFCINGYKNRQIAKRADAINQAGKVFNFASYDTNRDGVLQWSELAIVMVIPQKAGFGKARVQVDDDACNAPPLAPDGVIIPDIVEWYTSAQPGDFMVAAHELGHQILGLDDIYSVPDVSRAGLLSLMSLAVEASGSVSTTAHLDPLQKLALGWVTPQIVDKSGSYLVEDVKLSDSVLVLPRYRKDPVLPWFASRGQEYYLVENRQQGLAGLYDAALDDSGIAVWHVIAEPNDNAKTPRGIAAATWTAMDQTQARRGLRLLKRFGSYVAGTNSATVQPGGVLWDMFGVDFMSGTCNNAFPDNFMSWADCTPSDYGLRFLSGPANTMNVQITVP